MKLFYKRMILLFFLIIIAAMWITPYETFSIPVYDEGKPTYNIGDILHMPYYAVPFEQYAKVENPVRISIEDINKHYPESILFFYINSRPIDELIPNIERIRYSVDEYIKKNSNKFQHDIDMVSNEKTLTVHLRSGDKGIIDESYFNILKELSKDYDNIFILTGIHSASVDKDDWN